MRSDDGDVRFNGRDVRFNGGDVCCHRGDVRFSGGDVRFNGGDVRFNEQAVMCASTWPGRVPFNERGRALQREGTCASTRGDVRVNAGGGTRALYGGAGGMRINEGVRLNRERGTCASM